jgi:UDP-N-acetylmuramoylalanine--D-glutamate ligase
MEKKKEKNMISDLLRHRDIDRFAFSDIAHRLETVIEHNGVEWINDSKSTDIEATSFSIEMIEKPIIWIVGADESRRNLILIKKLVKYKVMKIVCFGDFDTAIKYSLGDIVESYAYKPKLSDAVQITLEWSCKGQVVLFSPACPSIGQFENYKQRGKCFSDLVMNLTECNL